MMRELPPMTPEEEKREQLSEEFEQLALGVEQGEREIAPEVRQTASNLVEMFALKPHEDFVVATDSKVMAEFPEMLVALRQQAEEKMRETGGHFRILVAKPADRSAVPWGEDIGRYLEGKPVLIITCMSRTWSAETQAALYPKRGLEKAAKLSWADLVKSEKLQDLVGRGFSTISPERLEVLRLAAEQDDGLLPVYREALEKYAERKGSRVISITKGTRRDVLTEGAALEAPEELAPRAEFVKEAMKDVQRVHITNPEGTDLWMGIRPEFDEFENGRIERPGQVMNFPIGEWACLARQDGTSGTLVIKNAPMGGAIPREEVPDRVTIKIENGLIVDIQDEGSGAAEKLRKYLESGRPAEPTDSRANPFKIAELGIGINTKAFRIVEGQRVVASTSVEAEKLRGTIHIAAGANGTFGQPETDPEFNPVSIHCDMVVTDPTVECHKKDGSTFNLIENGKPQGY